MAIRHDMAAELSYKQRASNARARQITKVHKQAHLGKTEMRPLLKLQQVNDTAAHFP